MADLLQMLAVISIGGLALGAIPAAARWILIRIRKGE